MLVVGGWHNGKPQPQADRSICSEQCRGCSRDRERRCAGDSCCEGYDEGSIVFVLNPYVLLMSFVHVLLSNHVHRSNHNHPDRDSFEVPKTELLASSLLTFPSTIHRDTVVNNS